MKILFVSRSAAYFHYYRSIVEALLERGHKVQFLYDKHWTINPIVPVFSPDLLDNFKKENPNFDHGWAVLRDDRWRNIYFYSRELLNYRHHLIYTNSPHYLDLWSRYLPNALKRVLKFSIARTILKSGAAKNLLSLVEKLAPPYPPLLADIKERSPDVLVASPANMRFSSAEVEYLKATELLGIPTAVPVHSWDNLGTKGRFHVLPTMLLAWNESQKKEAIQKLDIRPERVKLIGAPVFDKWFLNKAAFTGRKEFCASHGLREDPFLLYLGSSSDVGDETWLMLELRNEFKKHRELQNVQLVVRPHPANAKIVGEKLEGRENIVILPKGGSLPDSKSAMQLAYDSYFHSVALTGLVTSAMIEALIAERPVISLVRKEYIGFQEKGPHFKDLKESGAIELAYDWNEFAKILKELLVGVDRKKTARAEFVKNFIRPLGLEKSAGEAAADEIEKLIKRY